MDGEATSSGNQPGDSPAAPVTPAPAATTDDRFIQVPRDSIPDGDWHALANKAKQFDAMGEWAPTVAEMKAAGYTPAQISAELAGQGAPGYAPAPAVAPQADIGTIVESAVQRAIPIMRGQFRKDQEELFEQREAQSHQEQLEEHGRQREVEATNAFVTSMGAATPEGEEPSNEAGMYGREFGQRLQDTMVATAPEGLQPGTAEYNSYLAQPTDEHLKTAAEEASWLKHMEMSSAAKVAAEQEKIASETLGEGAGGGETRPDVASMTREQYKAAVLEDIHVNPEPLPEH